MNRIQDLVDATPPTLDQPETGAGKKRGAIGKGLIAFLLTGSLGTALLVYLFFMLIGR